jgi:hypothetical protein
MRWCTQQRSWSKLLAHIEHLFTPFIHFGASAMLHSQLQLDFAALLGRHWPDNAKTWAIPHSNISTQRAAASHIFDAFLGP